MKERKCVTHNESVFVKVYVGVDEKPNHVRESDVDVAVKPLIFKNINCKLAPKLVSSQCVRCLKVYASATFYKLFVERDCQLFVANH